MAKSSEGHILEMGELILEPASATDDNRAHLFLVTEIGKEGGELFAEVTEVGDAKGHGLKISGVLDGTWAVVHAPYVIERLNGVHKGNAPRYLQGRYFRRWGKK